MSISLGDRDFAGPYPIDQWTAPHQAGIYVILWRRHATDGDPVYTPLYFGRTADLAAEGLPTGHPQFARWVKEASGREQLYIGMHYMPGESTLMREVVERTLLDQYRPGDNYSWSVNAEGEGVNRIITRPR